MWKVEFVSNKTEYVGEEISKQSVGVLVFLAASSKMWEDSDDRINQMMIRKWKFDNCQSIHIAKSEKACSEKGTNGVSEKMIW